MKEYELGTYPCNYSIPQDISVAVGNSFTFHAYNSLCSDCMVDLSYDSLHNQRTKFMRRFYDKNLNKKCNTDFMNKASDATVGPASRDVPESRIAVHPLPQTPEMKLKGLKMMFDIKGMKPTNP